MNGLSGATIKDCEDEIRLADIEITRQQRRKAEAQQEKARLEAEQIGQARLRQSER